MMTNYDKRCLAYTAMGLIVILVILILDIVVSIDTSGYMWR